MPKRNDDSQNFSDWTTKKLKSEFKSLHDLIYGEASCYGTSDLRIYDGIQQELEERGVTITSQVAFN